MNSSNQAMTTKEYLSQAYRIDQRINGKLNQLADLRLMATNVTAHITDMPGSDSPNLQTMESTVIKIVDMEQEITADIDALVDFKRKISSIFRAVTNPEWQLVLEQRYLCFMTWEQIAELLEYSVQHVFRIHGQALKKVAEIMEAGEQM